MKNECAACKVKYSNPVAMSPGNIPVSLIMEHCKGHTRTLNKIPENGKICFDCLFEILLDSQWSVGWKKRAFFIYGDIGQRYWDTSSKTEQKGLQEVYTAGISALSCMCIKCSKDNDNEDSSKEDASGFLKKLNQKYLDKYVPKEAQTDFDNLICKKCATSTKQKRLKKNR